jgi:hypothetical protein
VQLKIIVLMVHEMAKMIDTVRMDRTAFQAMTFEEPERADREYWWSRPPEEHWNMTELLRQIAYGYDRATFRIPRPINVLEREG